MKKYKVVIVDDEPLAREIIFNFLHEREDIEIAAQCENGFDCVKTLQNIHVDILFLDVQMPKINGFELIEILPYKPEIIFCTAFDEFAIKAFEVNAIDYLMKPFSKERINKSLDKAINHLQLNIKNDQNLDNLQKTHESAQEIIDRIIVRKSGKIIVIATSQISHIEAQDDYVMIYSDGNRFLQEKTMKYYETHLNEKVFLRLHRSYIANINFINSIEPYTKDSYIAIMKNGDKIKVSQQGYKRFREILG